MVSGSMSHTSAPRPPSCSGRRRLLLTPWERQPSAGTNAWRGAGGPWLPPPAQPPLTRQASAPRSSPVLRAEPRGSRSRFPREAWA